MKSTRTILQTERLILRRFRASDFEDLYEYLSDPETVKYEPYKPMTAEEVRHTLEWRIESEEMIAVELKLTHKMIGNIYIGKRDFNSLELGYIFNRNYWGNGYAAESCTAITKLSFSEGVHRIYAECDPNNKKSWKLLENIGFKKEAHLKQNIFFLKDENDNPIWKDTYIYAKLNTDAIT